MSTTTPARNSNQAAFQVRGEILAEATRCVNKDRNATHGNPEDNFGAIARRWNAHIKNKYGVDINLDPASVGLMMVDMKLARIEGNATHKDSYVDAAGYVACAAGISLTPQPEVLSSDTVFAAAKAQADMQRAYTDGVIAATKEFRLEPAPTPTPETTFHSPGVTLNPRCENTYPNLLICRGNARKNVDQDFMYNDLCEYLESTKNCVFCVSASALSSYRKMHMERLALPPENEMRLHNHIVNICQRQGHTLYLY